MVVAGQYTDWWVGITLGSVAVAVVVVIVAILLTLVARMANGARAAADALPAVRDHTDALARAESINGSAISILRSVRGTRKALTGS